MNSDQNAANIKIICIGDKSKSMLSRYDPIPHFVIIWIVCPYSLHRKYPKNILMMFNDFGKKPPQFNDATTVANAILESGYQFEEGILIYNKFR